MNQPDPAWRTKEKIISLIELALAPHATVHHDVNLPVIGSKRTRQCDVVVRIGAAPRESIYIVEVQDRSRPPEITTFDGWVAKMNSVGANGLICVSMKGFPQSIIEDVRDKHGPKIRLMTLTEEEVEGDILPDIGFPVTFSLEVLNVEEIVIFSPLALKSGLPVELQFSSQPFISFTGQSEDSAFREFN